jgi:trimeric autotransporter adhesin
MAEGGVVVGAGASVDVNVGGAVDLGGEATASQQEGLAASATLTIGGLGTSVSTDNVGPSFTSGFGFYDGFGGAVQFGPDKTRFDVGLGEEVETPYGKTGAATFFTLSVPNTDLWPDMPDVSNTGIQAWNDINNSIDPLNLALAETDWGAITAGDPQAVQRLDNAVADLVDPDPEEDILDGGAAIPGQTRFDDGVISPDGGPVDATTANANYGYSPGFGYGTPTPYDGLGPFDNSPDPARFDYDAAVLDNSPDPARFDYSAAASPDTGPYDDATGNLNYGYSPGFGYGTPTPYDGLSPSDNAADSSASPDSGVTGDDIDSTAGNDIGDANDGSGSDDGGDDFAPILLDLSGKGIKITELTRSNTFLDTTGSGLAHRTAWAGAGTAVLFYDPNNLNKIVDKNQYIFTQWDPTAKDDMQALRDVFDSNGDGVFNASDAKWSQFKVMVTNADGTTTAETLAQAGIVSINLTGDTTDIQYADGSAITSETTFTKSDGTTGTVAATTLASDASGYAVSTSTNTSTVGGVTTTVITNTGANADGSVAFMDVQTTVVNGSSVTRTTTYDDNGDGVIDRKQVIATTVDGSGNTTELWTNYSGGGTKLSAVQTVTSADGKTITISRDTTGGSWFAQVEVQATAGDGSRTDTITNLNADGSEINKSTTSYSANGLTKTVAADIDGNGTTDRTVTDSLVVNGDGSRNETVTTTSNNGSDLGTVWTATSANGKTQTVSTDHMGSGTADHAVHTVITINADGTSTSTLQNYGGNGSYIDGQTVTKSADGLSTTTVQDLNGTHGADRTTTDTMTLNADGSRDEVVAITSLNGSLVSQVTTHLGADQISKTVSIDSMGIGHATSTETVSINATTGVKTDTISNLAANGSLLNQAGVIASADGLSKTTTMDVNGDGTIDTKVTDVTVKNADGSATEAIGNYASNGTLLDQTIITTSADGLTVTTVTDVNGDGVTDITVKDQKVNNADGSVAETVTTTSANGSLLHQAVTLTSADRRTQTITDYGVHTVSGTNTAYVDKTESITTASNGTVTDLTSQFAINGNLVNRAETVTSANGLTTTTNIDATGHGNAWDRTITATTTYNADGSILTDQTASAPNATLLDRADTSVNGTGTSNNATQDVNADGVNDLDTKTSETYSTNGSLTTTVGKYNGSGSTLLAQTQTLVSANGLNKTVSHDFNGDGTIDQTSTDNLQYNANGSTTETVTDYTGTSSGTVRDVSTTTANVLVSGIGRQTTTTLQSNGSVPFYSTDTVTPLATGEVDETVQIYASQGGALLRQTKQAVSGNDLTTTLYTDVNGDGTWDFWNTDARTINADGSGTDTASLSNASGLVSEKVTTVSGNGLSTTTSYDQNGAVSGGAAVFNKVVTDVTAVNADGSKTETATAKAQNGSTETQSVTTTSADRLTVTTNRYLDETGTITHLDQSDVDQTNADGSLTETLTSWSTTAVLLSTIVTATTANGLASTLTYKNGSGVVTDTQTAAKTLNTDGSATTVFSDSDVVVSGTTLATSRTTNVSGNGLTSTTSLTLSGRLNSAMAASTAESETSSTVIAATGTETTTNADTVGGTAADTETITVSGNGLSTTTSLQQQGAASPLYTDQKTINLDGSSTETETYYDQSALSTILAQTITNVSWDGRTTTTTTKNAYDASGQTITADAADQGGGDSPPATYTPSFATSYDLTTDVYVRNADSTTTETRSGTGAFGAPAYEQTFNWSTTADGGQLLAITNQDARGVTVSQNAQEVSAAGLTTGFAFDTTGLESKSTLTSAASDIKSGSSLPRSMLATDIIGSVATVLNADGSQTTTTQSAFGSSFSNLRQKIVTTVSANGLVTVKQVDNDGNGVVEQVDTTTVNPDGSSTTVDNYYSNTTGPSGAVTGSNTYTRSANGLITTLVASTGITDTTVEFADAYGSYQWSRSVTAGSVAASNGSASGWSTHSIDASGMDTWTINDGLGDAQKTITISVGLENQYITQANELYRVMMGHAMDDSETQYLSEYITNGVFNEEQLAYKIYLDSPEYHANYALWQTYQGIAGYMNSPIPFYENAFGRLPTAEEMTNTGYYIAQENSQGVQGISDDWAQAAVQVAQYAADYDFNTSRTATDPNVSLLFAGAGTSATSPNWISPGSSSIQVGTAGTYSYSHDFIVDMNATSGNAVAMTINGSDDLVQIQGEGGSVTMNGFNDSVEVMGYTVTVTASNADVLLDYNSVATVTGNYDQIAQAGPSKLTLNAGSTNDVIAIGAGPSGFGDYPNSDTYSTTSASNASIMLAAGAADVLTGSGNQISLANGDTLTASSNTISIAAGATVTLTGSSDTINVSSGSVINFGASSTDTLSTAGLTLNLTNGDVITASSETIGVAASATATVTGSGNTITLANGAKLTASNDAISAAAAASVTVTGNGDTITGGSGAVINLGTSSTDTVATAGLTVKLVSGDSLTASSDTVSVAASTTVTVTGNSDTITGGSGTVINLGANSTDTVSTTGVTVKLVSGDSLTASSDTVSVAAGASATITGNSDTITGGAGSIINFGASSTDTVSTTGLALNLANSDTITASSETVGMANSSTDKVTGNSNVFNVGSGDTLTLSGTSETVQYGTVTGADTLTGFASSDIIQLSHLDFANWTALQAAMTQSGSNTVIRLDASDTITLTGVTKTNLTSSEFRFA